MTSSCQGLHALHGKHNMHLGIAGHVGIVVEALHCMLELAPCVHVMLRGRLSHSGLPAGMQLCCCGARWCCGFCMSQTEAWQELQCLACCLAMACCSKSRVAAGKAGRLAVIPQRLALSSTAAPDCVLPWYYGMAWQACSDLPACRFQRDCAGSRCRASAAHLAP
jgi:hypothetical protein